MKILCWKLKFECLTAETKANNCVMDSFQMPFVTTNTQFFRGSRITKINIIKKIRGKRVHMQHIGELNSVMCKHCINHNLSKYYSTVYNNKNISQSNSI